VRAAITGVNGFVGSHLAEELLARGDEAIGVCRDGSSLRNLEGVEIELRRAHVLDEEALAAAFSGCELVYHVAGLTKTFRAEELWAVNAEGAGCAVRAARAAGVRRLLLVSSLAAFGPATLAEPAREDRVPAPVSKYGRSKRDGEIEAWRRSDDLELVIVRPPVVYGPRDADMLQNILVAKRGMVAKPGLGEEPHYSIIHARDLAAALWLAAARGEPVDSAEDPQRPSGQGIFHVDDGAPISWTALSLLQARLLGRRARVIPVPFFVQSVLAWGWQALGALRGQPPIFSPDKVREARQAGWVLDGSRAREELGFAPERGLEAGMTETIAWYQEHGLL